MLNDSTNGFESLVIHILNYKQRKMEIDFIKELFSGKKIYLTTDLSDIFRIQISRRPGYLMNGTLNSDDAWRPITIFTGRHMYYGNVNGWGGVTDSNNNWQGAFTLKPITPIYEVYTLNGWEKITAEEYEVLTKVPKVAVRATTRRNCIEVTDLIDFF